MGYRRGKERWLKENGIRHLGLTESEKIIRNKKSVRRIDCIFSSCWIEIKFLIASLYNIGANLYNNKQMKQASNAFELCCRSAGTDDLGRSYELLHVLEFSSQRKAYAMIVRNEEGVMFERLSKDGQMFVAETKNHIRKFVEAGLRTMVVAYREIGEEEYKTWKVEFF
ncbi:hypothetical protein IFM89_034234 [Coptis chinensis]|uniref:Uncharacterized protein n=1 Tax=Coptis chinensis TaxID=261450 RepID=A0A835HAA5_9MAGN|nr:hypothetical protein IFM89_034234 [Coptis chinensis]